MWALSEDVSGAAAGRMWMLMDAEWQIWRAINQPIRSGCIFVRAPLIDALSFSLL
jgi:hypothetical protein